MQVTPIGRANSVPVSAGTSLLVVYAATNLAVGLALAFTQPSRADDLWIMDDWCRAWLLHGQQLYAGVDARTDYPPNAIVLFAPIALVPRNWLVPAWTVFTLALTPLYAYVVIKSTAPRIRTAAAVVPMLLFFCWGGVRTFLEFSRLSLTLGFIAVLAADSRPIASGVSLGLALAKPHIAGPVMLWALVTQRARVAAVAMCVVAAGFTLYCLRVHVGPVSVVTDYGRVLLSLYSGADGFVGRTSLRPWWLAIAGDQRLGDLLWGVGAGLLLLVPCALAKRATDRPDRRSAAVLALFCLWSLLTIYHIGNNLSVLMLPSFAFLLLLDDPATATWRTWMVVAIQATMMLDIPVHLASWVPDRGLAFDRGA